MWQILVTRQKRKMKIKQNNHFLTHRTSLSTAPSNRRQLLLLTTFGHDCFHQLCPGVFLIHSCPDHHRSLQRRRQHLAYRHDLHIM